MAELFGVYLQDNAVETAGLGTDFKSYWEDGIGAVCKTVALTEAAKKVKAMSYFQKSDGWMTKLLEQQGKDYAVAAIVDKAASAEVDKIVEKDMGIDGSKLNSKVVYTASKFDTVFERVVCKNLAGQNVISLTHFCCAEVRFLLEGSELLVAWRYDDVPGETLTQKLQALNSMNVERGMALAKRCGFVHNLVDAGSLLVVPAGMILASVTGSKGSTFLRWCLSMKADARHFQAETRAVHDALAALLAAYPSLSKGLHQQWLNHLGLHLK